MPKSRKLAVAAPARRGERHTSAQMAPRSPRPCPKTPPTATPPRPCAVPLRALRAALSMGVTAVSAHPEPSAKQQTLSGAQFVLPAASHPWVLRHARAAQRGNRTWIEGVLPRARHAQLVGTPRKSEMAFALDSAHLERTALLERRRSQTARRALAKWSTTMQVARRRARPVRQACMRLVSKRNAPHVLVTPSGSAPARISASR